MKNRRQFLQQSLALGGLAGAGLLAASVMDQHPASQGDNGAYASDYVQSTQSQDPHASGDLGHAADLGRKRKTDNENFHAAAPSQGLTAKATVVPLMSAG